MFTEMEKQYRPQADWSVTERVEDPVEMLGQGRVERVGPALVHRVPVHQAVVKPNLPAGCADLASQF